MTQCDRYPILLILLDGLGDRAVLADGSMTPAEMADTPVLDALAAEGASGLHVPLGLGRAPSSEVAHWSLLGYSRVPFCGRAVLEALGHEVDVPEGQVVLHAALRGSSREAGKLWPSARATQGDESDAAELFEAVDDFEHGGVSFSLAPIRTGEAILWLRGARSAEVTDTDPFFAHHPWMRPLPFINAEDQEGATQTASALFAYLRWSRAVLSGHPINERRRQQNRPQLDVLTTKWAGSRRQVSSFQRLIGLTGAIVASSALYAGLAKLLGMQFVWDSDSRDPRGDIERRIARAADLIESGVGFVHVHTKATDEAGHMKNPDFKRSVVESLDSGLHQLLGERFRSSVIAVTSDHATPSSGSLLHSGDGSPFVVRAPELRPDPVRRFGESHAAKGAIGRIAAAEVLPLLVALANRPAFLGSKIDPYGALASIDDPVPMPDD